MFHEPSVGLSGLIYRISLFVFHRITLFIQLGYFLVPFILFKDRSLFQFNGKPSYRFELKEDDNTLSGYAKGETKGRAEFSYCYATSDDFKGKPADTYKKAQIMKTVYHHGKGICPQGASRDYEFSVYIPCFS